MDDAPAAIVADCMVKLISFVDATRRGQCSLFGSVRGPSLLVDRSLIPDYLFSSFICTAPALYT